MSVDYSHDDEPDHLVAPMGAFLHGVLKRIKDGTLKPRPRGSIRYYRPGDERDG